MSLRSLITDLKDSAKKTFGGVDTAGSLSNKFWQSKTANNLAKYQQSKIGQSHIKAGKATSKVLFKNPYEFGQQTAKDISDLVGMNKPNYQMRNAPNTGWKNLKTQVVDRVLPTASFIAGTGNPAGVASMTALGGGINYASNRVFGKQDSKTALSNTIPQTIEMLPKSFQMAGISRFTNPRIEKAGLAGKGFVARNAIKAPLNVGEGYIMDKATGMETTKESVLIDALSPALFDLGGMTFKSANDARIKAKYKIDETLGTGARKNGKYASLDQLLGRKGKGKTQALGVMAGIEPYQDENGKWRVRFNKSKALIGLGLAYGGTKILKGATNSAKGSDLEDILKAQEVKNGNIKPQVPQVPSKVQMPVIEQNPLKATIQNPQTQGLKQVPQPVLEKTSYPTSSYEDILPQTSKLTGEKTLFETKPIETGAYSSELDPLSNVKVANRNEIDLKREAKAEYDTWYKKERELGNIKTVNEQMDIATKNIQENTTGSLAKQPEKLQDISNYGKGNNILERLFKKVYGNRYSEADKQIIEPFNKSKDLKVKEDYYWANELKKLDIKKGSKESALVQMLGEKKINYQDVVKQVGEVKAKKIADADMFFRKSYDRLIDEVNAVRKQIYPNNPDKIIPKRQDYYRHFTEMQEGIGALKNIFDTPANINSTLAGISADTKPKSKWLSFAQKRTGDKTAYDAVGGFIEYVNKATYAKNIDPHIENFRNLATDLAKTTEEGVGAGKLNNFIEFLDDYANDLSGKTPALDRAFQKYIPGGRKAMRALNWLNSRVKANTILFNASSSIAQLFNIPQGIANAGPVNSSKGLVRSLVSVFDGNKPIKQSRFISERYAEPFSKFDVGILNDVKKFGIWMSGVGDEIGTKYIWNSHYEKALSDGIENPIKYADYETKNLVGGRGIGEVPLIQKNKMYQLVAPFQLEVNNLWYVMKDWVSAKQFGKLATFFVASRLMNAVAKKIRGSDVSFDPINSVAEGIEAYKEEEDKTKGALRFAGRQVGEVLSNVPMGQTAAAVYPEYGFSIGDNKMPTRKDLFGEGDPTRFGSGVLVAKGIQDPIFKIAPPYGGQQLKRTIEGIGAVNKGYSESKGGKIQFPVETNLRNYAQAGVFGKNSLPEAQEYFDKERTPLGDKQSQVFKGSSEKKDIYNKIINTREKNATETKIKDKVKKTGEMQTSDDAIFYFSGDEVKSVKKKISLPKLTSNNELNKQIISDYKSDLTDYANYIMYQYESGAISEEKAGDELEKIASIKKTLSNVTKTSKAKKVNIAAISQKTLKPVKVQVKSPKFNTFEILDGFNKVKAPNIKAPNLEVPKFDLPKFEMPNFKKGK